MLHRCMGHDQKDKAINIQVKGRMLVRRTSLINRMAWSEVQTKLLPLLTFLFFLQPSLQQIIPSPSYDLDLGSARFISRDPRTTRKTRGTFKSAKSFFHGIVQPLQQKNKRKSTEEVNAKIVDVI